MSSIVLLKSVNNLLSHLGKTFSFYDYKTTVSAIQTRRRQVIEQTCLQAGGSIISPPTWLHRNKINFVGCHHRSISNSFCSGWLYIPVRYARRYNVMGSPFDFEQLVFLNRELRVNTDCHIANENWQQNIKFTNNAQVSYYKWLGKEEGEVFRIVLYTWKISVFRIVLHTWERWHFKLT